MAVTARGCARRGCTRAREFSWRRTAEETARVYRELLELGGHS